MTSGHDVSERLGTLGLLNHIFSIFLEKIEKKNILVLQRPQDQAIWLFAGLLGNPDMPLSLQEETFRFRFVVETEVKSRNSHRPGHSILGIQIR